MPLAPGLASVRVSVWVPGACVAVRARGGRAHWPPGRNPRAAELHEACGGACQAAHERHPDAGEGALARSLGSLAYSSRAGYRVAPPPPPHDGAVFVGVSRAPSVRRGRRGRGQARLRIFRHASIFPFSKKKSSAPRMVAPQLSRAIAHARAARRQGLAEIKPLITDSADLEKCVLRARPVPCASSCRCSAWRDLAGGRYKR